MNEIAMRLVREAVVRVLVKNPGDVEFYRAQVNDPLRKLQYRQALQQAIDESRQMLEDRRQNANQHSA